MSYFISPPSESDWRIEADKFTEDLRKEWPDAQIEPVASPESIHALSWTHKIGEWRLDGELTKNGNVVHLDGDVRACAEFATWFRTQVPADQELVFYDEGYSADVPLTADTTAAELASPFLVA